MNEFPHHYRVAASGTGTGEVAVTSPGLASLATNAPPEFDGPGGYWSPETLLLASVADCFVLSFRSVARASRLEWSHLECDVEGTLDRQDRRTRFTHLILRPRLAICTDTDRQAALRCLEKAERVCLITNSLSTETTLDPVVDVE